MRSPEAETLLRNKLEEGDRTRMKIFRVNPSKDLPIKTIEGILQKAVDLYRTGVIKIKGWPRIQTVEFGFVDK